MIPIIDLGALYSSTEDSEEEKSRIAKDLVAGCSDIGFVYLKNHNIPKAQVEVLFRESREFFRLPFEVKSKYACTENNHGYLGREVEKLNPNYTDFKESYDCRLLDNDRQFPNAEVPGFQPSICNLFESCHGLAHDLLELMAIGLGLDDPNYFRKLHPNVAKSYTTLRSLYYPSVSKAKTKPGQVRCGEHTDYGTLTLLFQDDVGGLEVKSRNQGYIPANPIPDTILVNIGDLMQRWTADKFVSTLHRALISEEESKHHRVRQSIGFFLYPEEDCIVKCIDGSDKYEPVTCVEYGNMRLKASFKEALSNKGT